MSLRRVPILLGALAIVFVVGWSSARASVGLAEVAAADGDGPITVFYPTTAPAAPVTRGPFVVSVAWQAPPSRGNGRLIAISHGSGGAPWVHSDLARALVEVGFVVAMPEHRGDNYKDMSLVGPESWKRRPAEVSRAIDAIGRDPRFAPLLALDRVGVYGMSAGGHTALSLAGGRWSPGTLKRHCEAHIVEDFHTCVGLSLRQTGGSLDGLKEMLARAVIRLKLDDDTWYAHADPRVVAIVSGVPFAADFDMASFAAPTASLALVTASRDRWLVPRFHSAKVLEACTACLHLADLPDGGHGALLSPLPPRLTGIAADLLNDPPGFDRSTVADIERRIAAFFAERLLP
jgi:predicted dienelactone hydrolase